MAFYLASTQLH